RIAGWSVARRARVPYAGEAGDGAGQAAEGRSLQAMSAIAPVIKKLTDLLGSTNVIADADALEPYARDASHGGRFMPDVAVRASSSGDVQKVVAIASEHSIPVTPRGLGSGKSGGALPIHGGIVLSMEKMTRIKEISRDDMLCVVEPGLVLSEMMAAVEKE